MLLKNGKLIVNIMLRVMIANAHYTIRSKRSLSYASQGKGIESVANAPTHLNLDQSVIPSPLACAGDQGFKLQVTIASYN